MMKTKYVCGKCDRAFVEIGKGGDTKHFFCPICGSNLDWTKLVISKLSEKIYTLEINQKQFVILQSLIIDNAEYNESFFDDLTSDYLDLVKIFDIKKEDLEGA